ncbi:MAG: diaminopimelate decarboxylase [Chloroflexota bacterium]|nr:diaminopimelate decarboxylase [Chloroflexota bacterium]
MLWPESATRDAAGVLHIGGVALPELAAQFGTPLFLYDESTLRSRARRFVSSMSVNYVNSRVVYAAKAYLSPVVARLLHEEGLGLDVVSGGELYAGLMAGIPAGAMTFHGSNKSETELREAVAAGIGLIAIDNEWELTLLERVTAGNNVTIPVLLRLNPGVDAHTHAKIRTGNLDSKFGLPIATGDAARAVARIRTIRGLALVGYHAHIGSQLFDVEIYLRALDGLLAFAAEMRDRHDVSPQIISPGGGFGISYEEGDTEADVETWTQALGDAMRRGCQEHHLGEPQLVIEPGRSIVGPAGVALYRVGAIKDIAGARCYVSVDGGMADNIRPTLYDARYFAAIANRDGGTARATVTIAGKYCESGDLLIEHIELPPLQPDDLLAVPAAGAYCLAMASNYNLTPRPAVVMVDAAKATLIRRRETYEDLLRADARPHDSIADIGTEA